MSTPVHELRRHDPGWPPELDRLDPPRERLRFVGALPDLCRAVAIVGTRSPDPEASDFTHDLAADLARAGCTIVSGGARGIDRAAHEGALAAGGRTVAVLAGGLAMPYPREHGPLFRRIVEGGGAVVSDRDDDAIPLPGFFLRRNGIVAALSRAVVVAQAPRRSGAINTAGWARSMEIPVLAVPYAPWDARGEGSLALISAGAVVCTRARDVLSVAALESGGRLSEPREKAENKNDFDDLDDDARRVRAVMAARARHVDEIAERAGMPVDRVQRALLCLLLLGEVEEREAGRYRRCGSRRT